MKNVKEISKALNLVPHPTCGLVTQTYLSKTILPKDALPAEFASDRAAGSVLYFMVTPDTQIRLHSIISDQMYHFYMGTPLEILLLYPSGKGEVKIIGHDIAAGQMPQLFIPAHTLHVSRLHEEGEFALLGTSEWIEVKPQDVVLGDANVLIEKYPDLKNEILKFTQ